MIKLTKISDISKQLNLVDPHTKKPQNYILRYWEKEFKEIRPKRINNRRYYTPKQIEIIKRIKFLLKIKGMTISGVKKSLKESNKLDDYKDIGLKTHYKSLVKSKSRLILEKLNKIKKYAKKNTS